MAATVVVSGGKEERGTSHGIHHAGSVEHEQMSLVVRQTAQQLMQQWSRRGGEGGPSSSTDPLTRLVASGQHSTASVSRRTEQQQLELDCMPTRWIATLSESSTLSASLIRSPPATAMITMFEQGHSEPISWHVMRAGHVGPAPGVGQLEEQLPPTVAFVADAAEVSQPPAHHSDLEKYGLTEDELKYFGMLPEAGKDALHSGMGPSMVTPKESLLASLRAPPSTVIPSPMHGERRRMIEGLPLAAGEAAGRPKIVIRNKTFASTKVGDHLSAADSDLSEGRATSPPPLRPPGAAGSGNNRNSVSASPRQRSKSFLNTSEKPLNQRFLRPGHCDATEVYSPMHMHALTRAVMSLKSASAAGRNANRVITSIDCSGTRLARQARFTIPTSFAKDGSPIWVPRRNTVMGKMRRKRAKHDEDDEEDDDGLSPGDVGFWPDEQVALRKLRIVGESMSIDEAVQTQLILNSVAERSLTLGYIAPLLFMKGGSLFRITTLIAKQCDLHDADAIGLAAILRAPFKNEDNGTNFECPLTHLDLSQNSITNDGAVALKKSIKYNTDIRMIILSENPITNEDGVLNDIKRRLRNNKKGISNLGFVAKLMQ